MLRIPLCRETHQVHRGLRIERIRHDDGRGASVWKPQKKRSPKRFSRSRHPTGCKRPPGVDRRAARKARRAERNRDRVVEEEVPVRIPDSPLSIEEPKPVDKSRYEQFRFSLSRQMMSRNGVPFITSIEGRPMPVSRKPTICSSRNCSGTTICPLPNASCRGRLFTCSRRRSRAPRDSTSTLSGKNRKHCGTFANASV